MSLCAKEHSSSQNLNNSFLFWGAAVVQQGCQTWWKTRCVKLQMLRQVRRTSLTAGTWMSQEVRINGLFHLQKNGVNIGVITH